MKPSRVEYGEPVDRHGECNAHLYIADNFGDNHTTIRCQLQKGHPGQHQESFDRQGKRVLVQWELDERSP